MHNSSSRKVTITYDFFASVHNYCDLIAHVLLHNEQSGWKVWRQYGDHGIAAPPTGSLVLPGFLSFYNGIVETMGQSDRNAPADYHSQSVRLMRGTGWLGWQGGYGAVAVAPRLASDAVGQTRVCRTTEHPRAAPCVLTDKALCWLSAATPSGAA